MKEVMCTKCTIKLHLISPQRDIRFIIEPPNSSESYMLILLQPWPIVKRFLNELHDGSIGLDVGCGNGKYLGINPKIFIVASDR